VATGLAEGERRNVQMLDRLYQAYVPNTGESV
jgi:hypothetical protein